MNKVVLVALLLLILVGYTEFRSSRAAQAQPCEFQPGQIVPDSVSSSMYGKSIAVNIYLPACYAANQTALYPVIYLLHGGGADETQWPDLNVQASADTLISCGTPPFVVVMPGGVYANNIDYGAFILNELLPSVESKYQVATTRPGRDIGGLSLGAYWALKIAFLHPNLFAAIGAYSPVISLGYADDPLLLARQADVQTLQGLRIALDVGDQDSLAYDTREFAQALQTQGLAVSLTIGKGGHNRPYWRAHTYDYLGFFMNTTTVTATPDVLTNVSSN